MEKRALLAVVLMFVVLLIYNRFLMPKRRPPPVPEVTQAEEVAAKPDTAVIEVVPAALPSIPSPAEPGKEIRVTTPLYTATFSSAGGVLTSFRLSQYLSSEDEPLEMVPEADRLPLGMALLMRTGERVDLAAAGFAVTTEAVTLEAASERTVGFELITEEGLRVARSYHFEGDTYAIGVDIAISGPGSDQVRAIEFGWQSGLRTTEANRRDDLRNFASITLTDQGLVKHDLGKVSKRKEIAIGGKLVWSGVKTKYFFAGLAPLDSQEVVANAFPSGEEAVGMVLVADMVDGSPQTFVVYAGPLDYEGLKGLGLEFEKAVDFGWKWIKPLSKVIFGFMLICHRAIPNYGLVIILLSALTKLLFWPLTQKSFKSMREMQNLQPALQELKEKYKNDQQRLNKAMMELYRERGVNPLGGCLPLMLQMPVFISLFNVLSKTIELRRASFVFWMKDLSAPDVVARLPFSLPFIGNAVSVLPILMGIAMFLQQKMSATDPKQAAMMYMLPIVFTVMFFRFPSGLVLYWLVNNVLTIAHQYLMARAERNQHVLTTGG